MAEAMTYNSLVSDIQTYAERNDNSFVSQIPRLIMMAENRIASEVHGLGYRKIVTFNLTLNDPILVKPARWRETVSFFVKVNGEINFLNYRAYEFCRSFWPDQTQRSQPQFFSDYDYEHYLLAPTPDLAYEAELVYHERPQPLDDTNQTNWTTQYAPQLILYGTLLEAQPWLKLDDRISVFQSLYDRAAQGVTQESQRRMTGDQSMMRKEG